MVDAFITRQSALLLPGMSPKVCSTADHLALDGKRPDAATCRQEGRLFQATSWTRLDPPITRHAAVVRSAVYRNQYSPASVQSGAHQRDRRRLLCIKPMGEHH
jgi:hypothetical protein